MKRKNRTFFLYQKDRVTKYRESGICGEGFIFSNGRVCCSALGYINGGYTVYNSIAVLEGDMKAMGIEVYTEDKLTEDDVRDLILNEVSLGVVKLEDFKEKFLSIPEHMISKAIVDLLWADIIELGWEQDIRIKVNI